MEDTDTIYLTDPRTDAISDFTGLSPEGVVEAAEQQARTDGDTVETELTRAADVVQVLTDGDALMATSLDELADGDDDGDEDDDESEDPTDEDEI